jgi:hypothetical protein
MPWSASDYERGGFHARSASPMFAPPICRRSRRNASRKVDSPRPALRRIRRRRRLPGEHRSERSEPSTQRAERAKQSMRLVDGQTPAAGCSLSTDSSAGSLTRCLPRTEEKVQTLLSRKDTGVTIAIVINCAQ